LRCTGFCRYRVTVYRACRPGALLDAPWITLAPTARSMLPHSFAQSSGDTTRTPSGRGSSGRAPSGATCLMIRCGITQPVVGDRPDTCPAMLATCQSKVAWLPDRQVGETCCPYIVRREYTSRRFSGQAGQTCALTPILNLRSMSKYVCGQPPLRQHRGPRWTISPEYAVRGVGRLTPWFQASCMHRDKPPI